MIGYLKWGEGTSGPFLTESVKVRHLYADNYEAWYEGRYRKVHIQVKRLYVVIRGKKITIIIDGV